MFQPTSLSSAGALHAQMFYNGGESVSDTSWEAVDEDVATNWVPDHVATHCMSCDCRFWTYNRRHHCRYGY